MQRIPYTGLCYLLACLLTVQSCNTDNGDTSPEFIADSTSFSEFLNWPLEKTYYGPDPLLAEMAHLNNDSTVIREVHFNNGQDPVNGKYPVGTLIVKYSHNPSGTVKEFTAMAKRGNNFSAQSGDWEFFLLEDGGKIATDSAGMQMRGADLMDGICIYCHSLASSDFVFSK